MKQTFALFWHYVFTDMKYLVPRIVIEIIYERNILVWKVVMLKSFQLRAISNIIFLMSYTNKWFSYPYILLDKQTITSNCSMQFSCTNTYFLSIKSNLLLNSYFNLQQRFTILNGLHLLMKIVKIPEREKIARNSISLIIMYFENIFIYFLSI